MKSTLLLIFFLALSVAMRAQITFSTSTTDVTCYGGNDGTASITSISGGTPFVTSTKGLLISEIFTDVSGPDSPFEFVELLATMPIDFSTTPYTIIFSNNGVATANGWVHGTNKTYAFEINTGVVVPGQVIYVGGTSMTPLTNQYRVINTGTTAGDGGIGTAVTNGILGNGGVSVDGVAVFNIPVASITSSTVPIDAIFYGDAIGSAFVTGATGYEMPLNDYYDGGKLDTTDFFIDTPASLQDLYIKANVGLYNTTTNLFSQPRQWIVTPVFTDQTSSILLDGLYIISWDNSCTSVYNPNLTAGLYSFTITDASANMAFGFVSINDGPMIDLGATADDTLACEGQAIVLSASNADIFIWDNGDTSTTTNASVDFDTTFYVTGIDTVAGCTYTDSVFIDVNQIPTVTLVLPFDSICNNGGNILLSGGGPGGGIYSGPGVSAGSLDPTLLSGSSQIDYTYSDGNGCSSMASDTYVVVNCLGIEDEENNSVTVYPNPATDFVWIETGLKNLKYSMMDLSGKVVRTGNLNNSGKIDLENLHTGIYILTLQNADVHKQTRIVKR